ncbi:hypothetical protein [Falsihalocynthiibacter sp. CO-5D18]|uniref:hypothetical protein n=1 Tax=Falsihalocynthiibacter sp. CO-5D18 TaxID=3240872 RepID=UPI00351025BE
MDWIKLYESERWHEIDIYKLSENDAQTLSKRLRSELPLRKYGSELYSYRDVIEAHHATNWADFYKAELYSTLERNSSESEVIGDGNGGLLRACYFAMDYLRDKGFWLPDDLSRVHLGSNHYFVDTCGNRLHLPKIVARQLDEFTFGLSYSELDCEYTQFDTTSQESQWIERLKEIRDFKEYSISKWSAAEISKVPKSEQKAFFMELEEWKQKEPWRVFTDLRRALNERVIEPNSSLFHACQILENYSVLSMFEGRSEDKRTPLDKKTIEAIASVGVYIGNDYQSLHAKAHESLTLRGIRDFKRDKKGGDTRKAFHAENRAPVISQMRELIEGPRPHTRSNAARLVYERGVGTSLVANLQLWKRYGK